MTESNDNPDTVIPEEEEEKGENEEMNSLSSKQDCFESRSSARNSKITSIYQTKQEARAMQHLNKAFPIEVTKKRKKTERTPNQASSIRNHNSGHKNEDGP